MLAQQSKKALNTVSTHLTCGVFFLTRGSKPLHIAVKKAGLNAVRLLLKVKSPVFLRSQDGSTPLYIATRDTVAAIVRLVGDAGPEEAFQVEDSVGNTPPEMATFNWLRVSSESGFHGTLPPMQLFNEGMLHQYRNTDP